MSVYKNVAASLTAIAMAASVSSCSPDPSSGSQANSTPAATPVDPGALVQQVSYGKLIYIGVADGDILTAGPTLYGFHDKYNNDAVVYISGDFNVQHLPNMPTREQIEAIRKKIAAGQAVAPL